MTVCIKAILQNKLIHLKLDCATASERSFIGVNAQFRQDSHLQLITLGCLELDLLEAHTAEFLKNTLVDLLKKYNVNVQVVSITSDNGANVVKSVEKMSNVALTATAIYLHLQVSIHLLQNPQQGISLTYAVP